MNLWILEPFLLPIFWMLINKILTSSVSKNGIYPELRWRCHVFPISNEQIPTRFSVEQFSRSISQFHSGIYMHSCKWHKLQACDAQFGWWLQDDFNPTHPISIDWVEASRRNPNKLGMWSLKSKFETTSQYVPHMPFFLPAQSRFVPAPFSVSGHSHHQVHLRLAHLKRQKLRAWDVTSHRTADLPSGQCWPCKLFPEWWMMKGTSMAFLQRFPWKTGKGIIIQALRWLQRDETLRQVIDLTIHLDPILAGNQGTKGPRGSWAGDSKWDGNQSNIFSVLGLNHQFHSICLGDDKFDHFHSYLLLMHWCQPVFKRGKLTTACEEGPSLVWLRERQKVLVSCMEMARTWSQWDKGFVRGLNIYRVSSPKSHIVSRCFSSFAPSKSPFWAIPFILWQLLGKVRRCRARRADPWDLQPNVGIWTTPYSMGDAMYATGHEPQRMQGMSLLFPPK